MRCDRYPRYPSREKSARGMYGRIYLADAIDYRFDRVEEAMVFGRAGDRAPLAG